MAVVLGDMAVVLGDMAVVLGDKAVVLGDKEVVLGDVAVVLGAKGRSWSFQRYNLGTGKHRAFPGVHNRQSLAHHIILTTDG